MELIVDDRRAYAYTGGVAFDPALPCVAFVHGAQHDHSVWILQSRYLAHHGYAVLAFDLPGHGRSEGPPLGSVEEMSGWVLRACQAAGVERPVLAGHSMGSLVALDAAGRAGSTVSGLVLVGSAFPMRVSDALLEAARTDESRAFDMINAWSHSGITHHPGTPGPGFSLYVQNRRLMQRQAPGVLLNDFDACNRYAAGFERAAEVRCPTLALIGQRDQMTPPKVARALAAKIPGSRVCEIPRCGHNLMGEHPEEVLAALKAFLPDCIDVA